MRFGKVAFYYCLFFLALPLLAQERLEVQVPPPPVKVQQVRHLPYFCVQEGLNVERKISRLGNEGYVPGARCSPPHQRWHGIVVASVSGDDIAKSLQPRAPAASATNATVSAAAAATGTATATASGVSETQQTEFVLTATEDKESVIIFRADRQTTGTRDLLKAIDDLAQPQYLYFQNYAIDSQETGNALIKVVAAINSKLSAEVITSTSLRVESNDPLAAAEIDEFKGRLKADQADIVAHPEKEKAAEEQIKEDRKGPADAVQLAAVDLPDFCQANDLETPPVPFDKDGCKDGARKVPAGNLDAILKAVNDSLSKASSKLTLVKEGGRILIECNGKCGGPDVAMAAATISQTARPVPMFAKDLWFPRGTAWTAASVLNSSPVTAVALTDSLVRLSSDTPVPANDLSAALEKVRERGFGDPQAQPLQRMFYHSPADVLGGLLSAPEPSAAPVLGGIAATAPVTGNTAATTPTPTASTATTTTPSAPTATTAITVNATPPAPTAAPAATPAAGPAPSGSVGQGMAAVGDSVVFTDTSSASAIKQRTRLLALLDMPRPEVLMNIWSFQASSPSGKEIAVRLQAARDLVAANNDALQHAIDYGWAYLNRRMKDPRFFHTDFSNYLTKRFVADTEDCEANGGSGAGCLSQEQRERWGLCDQGKYCLGYEQAFEPIRPTLTNILLAMMAAEDTPVAVLTTIGCMEGKFEVYGKECFPDRDMLPKAASVAGASPGLAGPTTEQTKKCLQDAREEFLTKHARASAGPPETVFTVDAAKDRNTEMSCDMLDRAAVYAERACGVPVTLPLSCFTLQAAKSFLPDSSFSTFSLGQLKSLAEVNLADMVRGLPPESTRYSAPRVGLLRSAVADFLFTYRMAVLYPADFSPYFLPHSAQELNAEFNPLIVAFNQDVAALSRTLLDEVQRSSPNQDNVFELWRNHKSYIADGMITVRGISGLESLVDTDTQSSFDATQAQTLGAVLASITGTGDGTGGTTNTAGANSNTNTININPTASTATTSPLGVTCASGSNPASPLCAAAKLLLGSSSALGIASLASAIAPQQTHAMIGRQLTLDVIPHTLPGASSAELDVRLWAQEDSAPTIYSEAGTTGNDYLSRVARHNVASRVRVESVKLFDISSFTAMIQRPRAKFPIVPPFVEIPLIGSLLSIPLPAAKVYHSSSAIVSAIIVPSAADLAYGMPFGADRGVFPEDKTFSHLSYSLRTLTSPKQFPETAPVQSFHNAYVKCLAMGRICGDLKFSDLPPDR